VTPKSDPVTVAQLAQSWPILGGLLVCGAMLVTTQTCQLFMFQGIARLEESLMSVDQKLGDRMTDIERRTRDRWTGGDQAAYDTNLKITTITPMLERLRKVERQVDRVNVLLEKQPQ